jgi:hypothetical protein
MRGDRDSHKAFEPFWVAVAAGVEADVTQPR